MRIPRSTYRLQIRPGLTLQDAADLAGYVKNLGADWVYLSPILTAEEGSDHGYDVTDPSAVDPARGGPAGLQALAAAAHGAGLGVLVDVVPNHMGVATPAQNPWWWALLKDGQHCRYAEAFDVDWDLGAGKIRIPVLGDGDEELDQLTVVPPADSAAGAEAELHYYENRYPLTAGSYEDGADARTVHGRQHYELINWRRADAELNYRRFFAVNTLAGVRVEVPWVFAESHAEILRWVREGLVDGLRIDHPDGLADPGGYLEQLRSASGGSYVLVEKILEPGESLPAGWACEGTSGYDALAQVDRLWVDPAGQEHLDALDAELRGDDTAPSWQDMIHGTKRMITDGILRSEVLRLTRLVPADTGLEADTAADVLAELLTCFPVYRSYLPQHRQYLHEAAQLAKQYRPDLSSAVNTLEPLLADAASDLAMRFQQTSGMVMAKGVEDTAFYRYTRLTSLTEVGADPSVFSLDVGTFHTAMTERLRQLPHSMTTLSTHDTKRGEDVRARISVLSERAPHWAQTLRRLQSLVPLKDGPLANLLWQAIVGAWPASRERLHAYAEKAAREAGNSTLWTAPEKDFEADMHRLIDAAFDTPEVNAIVTSTVDDIRLPGRSNALSAKLVQLMMPGVPDVYQGTELWEDSLVDPDNRRPVDFAERRRLLAGLDAGTPAPGMDDEGLVKLLLTSRALRLKRDSPELFTGYAPMTADGAAAEHLVAFDRGGAMALATRLPAGLADSGGWADTTVTLPAPVRDELTGKTYPAGAVKLADIFAAYPAALLVAEEEAR